MKTVIYFVRHGEVYNPTNVWYGRLPKFGLSEDGKKQIVKTASFLKKANIDMIYSSPLLRAKQTVEIIKQTLNVPLHYSDLLFEIKSSLQGTSFGYIQTLAYDVFAGKDKKDIVGETIEDVMARIETFMQEMIKKYPGKKIVAVTHGDLIMLVRARLTHLPIENASLRPEPDKYVQHGEVYQVTCNEKIPLTLKSVFKPS